MCDVSLVLAAGGPFMTPNIPPSGPGGNSAGWRWKPVDLAVLVIALVAWWPIGLAFLAWKLWNDRQPVPIDLDVVLHAAFDRLQTLFDGVMGSFGQAPSGARFGPPPVTGNAAFDAHVRAEWARMEADRRALDEEIEAFKTHLATERADDKDVYNRFRAGRAKNKG
jgi:hypothetical protein